MNNPSSSYAQSKGIRLLQEAVQELGPLFTMDQIMPLAAQQGIGRSQLRWLVSVLARSGWLAILKRGTYIIQTPPFPGEVHPFAIAAVLVRPMAISHWSALAHHGMTAQIPSIVQASTPRKVITPEMRKGSAERPRGRAVWRVLNVEFEFFHVQSQHFFGFQEVWVDPWHRVTVTDPERTALDLINHPNIFGGIEASIELLEQNLPNLKVEQLVQYALRQKVGAVIKRLGWTLEKLGVDDNQLVPLVTYPVTTYYSLDPRRPRSKENSPRWKINENLEGTGYGRR